MRMLSRSLLALSIIVSAIGCSGSLTESQSIAERLAGTWAEPESVPGESFVLILATHDTLVTGTGSYSLEAGASGTTTVAGTISGHTIDFDVIFDTRQVMHFRGELSGLSRLLGIWYSTPVGDPVNLELDKVR